uniref:SpaA isopeptide-forming pilin-related protein n=1 Tax=uncultured Ruminococcus sp. TaxID=165186 RepID=UPI0025D6BD55
MIRNPFKQGRKISGRKRIISGLTAGLLAASTVISSFPAASVTAADTRVNLGTFKYATPKEMGSANKYAAFAYTYTQANHMEGIFACNNYHPYGDAFGTTNNVVNYVDSKENHIYIGENIGGDDAELNVIEQVHQTNGINDDMLWDMILPDTITINRSANNGQGVQLENENGYRSGVFNSEKDLAKKIYHVSEVTYNIDFIDALTALDDYQEYWAKQDTSDVTEVTLPDKEKVDKNNWVIDIECAEGGNVVTLDAQDIKDSRLNIKAKDGVSDYSLIINVTGLNDGDNFDREIKIDDADSLYGPQAGKVLFNMLGEDGDQYYFTKLNQGVILAPTQEVYIYQTHNGSVMGFYVENHGCEIHQNGFRQLPVKDHNNIEISKVAVGGEKELSGARLTLTAASSDKDVDWNKVIASNDGVMPYGAGTAAPSGITWLSGSVSRIIKNLPDGDYALKETGAAADGTVVLEGKKYQVVPSVLYFSVVEGQLSRLRSTALGLYGIKPDGSYFTAENIQKTGYDGKIIVCDAVAEETSGPVDLVINKFDLTGENEVEGAKLTITGTTDLGQAVSMEWTSKKNETWNISLENGSYTLRETGDVIDTDDGVFEVVDSALSFVVKNGTITDQSTDKGADISMDGFNSKADDGYFTVGLNADKAYTVNVCDARRTDVKLSKQNTGGSEIPDAKLTLTGKDADGKNISFENVRFARPEAVIDGRNNGEQISWISGREPVEVVGLPNGTYTFHEEAAPQGYQITTDIIFEAVNGKVTVTSVNGKAVNGTVVMIDNRNTTVSINKFDLTGKNEVAGAKLTVKGYSDEVKEYEHSWISEKGEGGVIPEIITGLADGTYTLTEEAADASGEIFDEASGRYYKVIKDTLFFTVKDGSIFNMSADKTDVYGDVPDATPADEYFVVGENEIGICDAEIKQGTVKLNKYDISGENEIAGAHLTITGGNADWARIAQLNPNSETVKDNNGKVIGVQWTSQKNSEWEVILRDGKGYVLTETAVDNDGDTEYEVIPSDIAFDIVDGKVANIDNKKVDVSAKVIPTATDEKNDSYVVASNGNNEILICDAKKIKTTKVMINKTDITGEEELDGAILTVTDSDGKTVGKSWTS